MNLGGQGSPQGTLAVVADECMLSGKEKLQGMRRDEQGWESAREPQEKLCSVGRREHQAGISATCWVAFLMSLWLKTEVCF